MSYEFLRHIARKYDEHSLGNIRIDSPVHDSVGRTTPPNNPNATLDLQHFLKSDVNWCRLARRRHIIRSVLYGLQVFYSYLLMLVAMTYQVIISSLMMKGNVNLCRDMFLLRLGLVLRWDFICFMMIKRQAHETWHVIKYLGFIFYIYIYIF